VVLQLPGRADVSHGNAFAAFVPDIPLLTASMRGCQCHYSLLLITSLLSLCAAAAAGVDIPAGLMCHMEVQVELLREDKLKDKAWLDGERHLSVIVMTLLH
jgi:hypothetical protein